MAPFSVEFQHLGEAGFSTTPGLPHAPRASIRAEAKMHRDVYFTRGSLPGDLDYVFLCGQGHTVTVSGNSSFRGQTGLLAMRVSRPPCPL